MSDEQLDDLALLIRDQLKHLVVQIAGPDYIAGRIAREIHARWTLINNDNVIQGRERFDG